MECPSCGASNESAADDCFSCGRSLYSLTRGAVLSERYEILSLLGKGGMGMVYKAHDRELDEVVALKILRGNLAQSAEMARRFRSEIKLARRVRHKNVCGIHEYGQSGHIRYIAMEYVAGVDLKTLLRRGPLPPDEAFDAAIQVANGLHAVHEVGIVHRDLKTPNIMRDGRGLVRLMDFGIAKSLDAEATGATASGQIVGTPEYMSPEQVRGEKLDARSDIYALGIVVYELFIGDVPLRGDSTVGTLMKHLEEAPPLEGPPAVRLPLPLVPVLRKALAKPRDDRFGSSESMAEALTAARREAGLRGRPVSTVTALPHAAAVFADSAAVPEPLAPPAADTPTPVQTQQPTPVPTAVPMGVRRAMHLPSPGVPWPRRKGRGVLVAGVATAGLAAAWTMVRVIDPPVAGREPATVGPTAASATTLARPPEASPTPLPQARTPTPTPPQNVDALPPPTLRGGKARPLSGMAQDSPTAPSAAASNQMETPTAVPSAVAAEPAGGSPTPTQPGTSAPVTGSLTVKVVPWAEVLLDGQPAGRSPLQLTLAAGTHSLVFNHPSYQPLKRILSIRAGESRTLTVDLRDEALRRR
jgi:hypothetical protein